MPTTVKVKLKEGTLDDELRDLMADYALAVRERRQADHTYNDRHISWDEAKKAREAAQTRVTLTWEALQKHINARCGA